MKSTILITLLLVSVAFTGKNYKSTIDANDIVGTWWNGEKDAKIRIFLAQNGKYAGKIDWMKEPNDAKGNPKVDDQNPNPKLRSTPRLGMPILKNFKYNTSEKRWEGGTVYDPKNGKTYDGHMSFEGNNTDKLNMRGFVMGMSWLGRTAVWERVK